MNRSEADARQSGADRASEARAAAVALLADFLGSPQAPKGTLPLHGLDGYLTAVVIAPQLTTPSVWMSGIWGGEGPVFEDGDEAQAFLGALMLRYNDIVGEVEGARLAPLYRHEELRRQGVLDAVAQWSRGFRRGLETCGEDWGRLMDDPYLRALLGPIGYFCEEEKVGAMAMAPAEAERVVSFAAETIPMMVDALRRRFRVSAALPQAPQTPLRANRVGRNQPCPCGSGRKYKRCCGAGRGNGG